VGRRRKAGGKEVGNSVNELKGKWERGGKKWEGSGKKVGMRWHGGICSGSRRLGLLTSSLYIVLGQEGGLGVRGGFVK
jgi:hypothetical protein